MISITKTQLETLIQAGNKKEDLITILSTETVKLTKSDISQMLKQTGLRISRISKPKFTIIDNSTITLPLDSTIAKETKQEAEKGSTLLVDFSGYHKNLTGE